MGTYVSPSDCTEPAVTVGARHCATADTRIRAQLWNQGIDPEDVTLPNDLLTALGVAYATELACLERSRGEDTTLLNKSDLYARQAKSLAAQITRAALGLDSGASSSGSGLGSVPIGWG